LKEDDDDDDDDDITNYTKTLLGGSDSGSNYGKIRKFCGERDL
jgi:hypothetical protein